MKANILCVGGSPEVSLLMAIGLLSFAASPVWGQPGALDTSYQANVTYVVVAVAAEADGKALTGCQMVRADLEDVDLPLPLAEDDLLALYEALNRFAQIDPRAAELVKLCFFVGLTQPQAAKELGISLSTAERTWVYARAWLFREIRSDEVL